MLQVRLQWSPTIAIRPARVAHVLALALVLILPLPGPVVAAPSSGEVVIELDLAVTSGTDDAEQWQDGTINLSSSDLELVDDSGRGNQTVGIRFNGLSVPAGATITDASLQFQVDEASSGAVSLAIQAEDTDSASGFTTAAGEIGARARTAATVAWSPPGWPTVGSAGLDQRTPSLAALVQAVVGRSGWSSGNSIAFIITGSGTRWAESYDGDAAGAPKLHVAYATAPPEPPTISGVAPTSGPPGTSVTIDGSRLFGATSVTFNGVVAPFSVVSDAQLTATVPGAATSGPVSVTTGGGTADGPTFTVTEPPPTGAIRVPNDQPTIQAAIDVAQDGDVILIAPGTYHESVLISGKNLTLASQFYETGDPALIEATVIDTDGTADAITIRGTSGAGSSIVGLKLVKASALILDGIRVEGSARILDTHIVGFDDGVDLDPTGGAFAACECRRNLIELGTDDGFDLDGATGGIYEQNVLQNNVEDGIEVRLSDEAAEVPITFRDNEFRGNGQDGIQIIDMIGASNRVFTIERNRFIDNGRAAIGLMDNGQSGEDYRAASLLDRIALFNNTFSGNNHGVSGGDNVIGLNNLFVNSTGIGVKGVDGSSLLAYNLFWNNGTDDAASNLDMASSQFSDPQLAGDYSLTSGSPAIDAGVASYTFAGELVLDLQPGSYNGSAPDLGAFESSGGGPGGPAAPTIALPVDGATVTTRTFTVRGSAPTGTMVRLLADGSERASTVVANDGSWATVVNGLADGPHALTAVTIDALGAESLPSAQTSISVALVASDPVVAAAGDIACDHVGSTECRQMATSDLLLERNYDAVLTLGDHQYECGSPTEFALGYDPSWGRVKPITRPAVGNHEYFTDRGVDCDPTGTATGYFDYFGAAAGTQGAGWYSYDLGDWHLVALNSNCSDVGGCDAGSPQEQWLQADLAASAASCTLAYWHHPRWSSGSAHGSDPVTQALVDALYAHGAELILAGHDHHYERFGPQAPDGSVDLAHGIRAFVAGTGGKALVPLGTTAPNSELRADTAFGVLELTLGNGSYDWAFITEAGATTDAGTGGCHDAPGAADTTPPQTTIISGPSDPSTSANATFDVISSETGSTFECSMDGAAFTACTPPASYSGLAEGTHTFAARATDAASNTDPTPASWTWTVDTVAPSLIAAVPSDGATDVAIGAQVTATFDEPMGSASISTSTFRLTQGGAPVGASVAYEPTTRVATLTPDAPLGISVVYVVTLDGVADLAGNAMAITTWSFTTEADTTPPQTTITSGPDDPSSSPDATVTFTSSEVGSTFACSLDAGAFTACSSPITYTALADGPHEFAVRATDPWENTDPTPATWSWTIDTTVPPSPTTVTFTPNADAHVREASPNSNYGSSTTLITDGVDGGGAAEATVRFGVSGVGGAVQQARLRIWVTNKTNNGPAIYRSDAAWNEALVTWASRPARVGGIVASSGSIATGWYEFDVTSAVSGDGSYSFTLVPTSSDGLDFSSREGSVRPQLVVTFLGDDTTPPATSITSGPSGASGSSSATFTFISSELGSTFSCSLDAAPFTPCTSPQQYTGLANGDHDFAVRATDVSGNTDPTPATAAWTIVTATTDSFLAEADSTVDERRSTSNFGSATTLESDGGSGRAKQAFLRFDASGVSGVIVSAKLRVWVTNATSNGPQVFLADSGWSENTVTWATRPSLLSGAIDDAGSISAGAWYEFDVTAAVSEAGLYSFALASTSTDALKFASRETTTPPELLVAYGT